LGSISEGGRDVLPAALRQGIDAHPGRDTVGAQAVHLGEQAGPCRCLGNRGDGVFQIQDDGIRPAARRLGDEVRPVGGDEEQRGGMRHPEDS
jgi:hypothetical protein